MLAVAVALAGCGRSDLPGEDGASSTTQPPAPAPRHSSATLDALVGVWSFGPIVPKGFAGAPMPLASLEIRASGDFTMLFGSGCVLRGTTGTVSGHTLAATTWVDEATQDSMEVSAISAAPFTPALLVVDVTRADGTHVTQLWARRK